MQCANELTGQIIEVIESLPLERKSEVLDFALFLLERDQFKKWDEISDQEAFLLREEFQTDDIHLAENVLCDSLRLLRQEDQK